MDNRTLDLAFVPVDRRLKENSILAIDFFLNNIKVKEVFPMHFGSNYKYIDDLKIVNKKVNIIRESRAIEYAK